MSFFSARIDRSLFSTGTLKLTLRAESFQRILLMSFYHQKCGRVEVFDMNQARLEQEQRLKLQIKVSEENVNHSQARRRETAKNP
jgi:hypothetical protein